MHKILLICTGGTLASSNVGSGLTPELKGNDILSRIEGITAGFEIDVEELFGLDSSNMQPENWSELAEHIYHRRREYEGIVVIHGTDTLAFTASALSYALQNIEVPVVLTGSQVSIENPIADATENIRAAIHMAASGQPGVFVAFNRKIIDGTRASKVRTRSFNAFESINAPYAAKINSSGLILNPHNRRERDNICLLQNKFCTDVFLLKLFPGIHADIFEKLQMMGVKAVYVEAFGIGGLPNRGRDFTQAIREAVEQGMIIAVGSQCLYEGSDFSVYEVGRKAIETGVIQTGNMTAEAAITKLMWALGQYNDPLQVKDVMAMNLVGELGTSTDWI